MSEPTDTIVLIHGLWMTPLSWEHWIDRYTSRGYRVLAPAWPGLEGDIEQLRRDPSPFENLGIAQIVDHYEHIIRELEQPPIIIGHSFGGSFTQVLLSRGLGAAGVAISSGPVKGVLDLPLSTLRSSSPILRNPFARRGATVIAEKHFRYAFGNVLSEEDSRAAYERYAVPSANRVLFEGALANLSRTSPLAVDFRNDERAPLLFVGAGEDHVAPPKLVRSNVAKYAGSQAVTAYEEFPGRSHFTVGQDGWEAVADYALSWATANGMDNGPLSVPSRVAAVAGGQV
jgi:pimeloyl-ACP methyl ester carboxylesterase